MLRNDRGTVVLRDASRSFNNLYSRKRLPTFCFTFVYTNSGFGEADLPTYQPRRRLLRFACGPLCNPGGGTAPRCCAAARNSRGARMSGDGPDEPSLAPSASAPELDVAESYWPPTTDETPPADLRKMPLPFLVEDWCTRSLGDDTAPLLAMLAWQQRECEDPLEAQGWEAVAIQCEQSGRPLQQPPEPLAAALREASRSADVQLGAGPVAVSLAPPVSGLAATPSLRALPISAERYGTFGSSRDETPLPEGLKNAALFPLAETMRAGSINALRFRLPGPGSYSPAQDGRPYRLDMGNASKFAREDRYEHLARTNRPKGQYHCLPLRCGPAPGFYSNPKFGGPKERAVRGDRCQAKFFKRAHELPAGQPPERNRVQVATVRYASRLAKDGPAPWEYNTSEATLHHSEFPVKMAGRWTSAPASPNLRSPGSGAACEASADTSASQAVGEDATKAQGSRARLSIHAGKGGLKKENIKAQSKVIESEARYRRNDLRRREQVEDELDRVRQAHRLVAAGSKRSIVGRKLKDGEQDVGAVLKARLDGSLQRMSDLFKGFDSSWDGLVSRDEFGEALKLLDIPASSQELDSLFQDIDADGSGEIDFKELKRHLMGWKRSAEGAQAAMQYGTTRCSTSTAAASRSGTWSISAGRDHPTTLLNGIEPPERRSQGPASYEPRRGSAFVKPNVGLGGDQSKETRDYTRQLMVGGLMSGAYIHKGLEALVEQQDPEAELRMASRPASRGHATSPPRSAPGSARGIDAISGATSQPQLPASPAAEDAALSPGEAVSPASGRSPSAAVSARRKKQERKLLTFDVQMGTIPALRTL